MLEDLNIVIPAWRKECGAFGWDETKHDILDRAQLRCEIDALVAHLYGLNEQELEYLLILPGIIPAAYYCRIASNEGLAYSATCDATFVSQCVLRVQIKFQLPHLVHHRDS